MLFTYSAPSADAPAAERVRASGYSVIL